MATTYPRPEVDPRAAALSGGASFLVQRDDGYSKLQKANVKYAWREPVERVPGVPETAIAPFGDVRLRMPAGDEWFIELSALEYIVEWLRVNREAREAEEE